MNLTHLINKKSTLLLTAVIASVTAMAQNAPTTAQPATTSSYNQLATLLVVMTIVLAFVIWGLGQVLVVLSRQVMEKNKNSVVGKALTTILVMALLMASQTTMAQTDAAATAVKEVPNYGGLSPNTYYMFVIVIVTEVLAILFLTFSIRRIYTELMPQKEMAAAKKSAFKEWWSGLDKKVFTKAIPLEKEADHLLDHNYDGIQELDNALPPWWKYGFYITIVVAFIYIFNFHVMGNGQSPTQEYNAEMEKARIEKEVFEANNKDKVDENNVPMADAAGIAAAKEIFLTKCKACHGEQGQGGVGPNLTDDYWLHKGSLNDIFHTIKAGYADKGMQSWANDFTPKEISFLASFVKSLHGTNPPNPKAPQGEIYTEAGAAPVATDTAKAGKTDSAAVKNKNTTAVSSKKDSVGVAAKK